MAIVTIALKQFKCFRDSGRIELAPLTVIFGLYIALTPRGLSRIKRDCLG